MNAISENLIFTLSVAAGGLVSIALFFFMLTRLSLIIQTNISSSDPKTAHIYWIYKSPFFIKLADHMFVVSSILLLQYSKLVNCVVRRLNPSLKDKRVLQISCAFGNISEKVAESCARQGAKEFVVTDIMQSEIDNAAKKLKRYSDLCTYSRQDGTALTYENDSFDCVVVFFLPHELPTHQKHLLLKEANRVVKPGGRVVFGEFHKPKLKLLEYLGRLYFSVFEPYATDMWDSFDLSETYRSKNQDSFKLTKDTFLFENYQVLTAERLK